MKHRFYLLLFIVLSFSGACSDKDRPLRITTMTLPEATQGVEYSAQLRERGSKGRVTWSITGGRIPTGLSLEPRLGVISGIPTEQGMINFTIAVTDGRNGTRANLAINVN